MSKRRAIISYDKLSIDQKKQILRDYPDGYINHLTTIKTPTGETLDALIWETDEVIYLVKVSKIIPKAKPVSEVEEDDFDEVADIKEDETEDEEEDDFEEPFDDADEDDDSDESSSWRSVMRGARGAVCSTMRRTVPGWRYSMLPRYPNVKR